MKRYILILLIVLNTDLYSQRWSFSSSSSSYESAQLPTTGQSVMIGKKTEKTKGKESTTCYINDIEIDCKLLDCWNAEDMKKCKEIEEIIQKISSEINTKESLNSAKESEIKESKDIFIRTQVSKSEIFIGEQISCVSKIYIKEGASVKSSEIIPITYDGFWEDEVIVDTEKRTRKTINGKQYIVITFRHSILTAQKSGILYIPSSEMKLSVSKRGKMIYNHPFFGPQYDTKTISKNIKSNTNKIKVKDLPIPKPKDFYGTVGSRFKINSEINRNELKTSEAINYKLTIRGNGNINMLNSVTKKFPESFEDFDPIIQDRTESGNYNTYGSKIFEYILIPREKGEFLIPKFKFNYFDTKENKYVQIETKEHKVIVGQGAVYQNIDSLYTNPNKFILLKESNFTSIERRKSLYKWYNIISSMISLIIIGMFITQFILSKITRNPISQKMRKATKIAIKRLKNAKKCIKTGDFDRFFEEVEKSLWGYFSHKFNVNLSKLSKDTIESYFLKNNISENNKNEFIQLLNECEFARFSSSNEKNNTMEAVLEKAKNIIIKVETQSKS